MEKLETLRYLIERLHSQLRHDWQWGHLTDAQMSYADEYLENTGLEVSALEQRLEEKPTAPKAMGILSIPLPPPRLPLNQQPAIPESVPECLARVFAGEGIRTWADVAALPNGVWFLYPGVGNRAFRWIRAEVSNRAPAGETFADQPPPPISIEQRSAAKRLVIQPRRGVYFIQCHGFIKIGQAKNIRKRFNAFRQTIPQALELRSIVDVDDGHSLRAAERSFHERFKDHRAVGEWYRAEGPLLAFCDEMAAEIVGVLA